MHATASPAERTTLEAIIYTKSIDFRRDVKRGTIGLDPIVETLLADYRSRVKQTKHS